MRSPLGQTRSSRSSTARGRDRLRSPARWVLARGRFRLRVENMAIRSSGGENKGGQPVRGRERKSPVGETGACRSGEQDIPGGEFHGVDPFTEANERAGRDGRFGPGLRTPD